MQTSDFRALDPPNVRRSLAYYLIARSEVLAALFALTPWTMMQKRGLFRREDEQTISITLKFFIEYKF